MSLNTIHNDRNLEASSFFDCIEERSEAQKLALEGLDIAKKAAGINNFILVNFFGMIMFTVGAMFSYGIYPFVSSFSLGAAFICLINFAVANFNISSELSLAQFKLREAQILNGKI